MKKPRKVCVCQVNNAEVRQAAKRLNVPLKWLRDIKRMHRRFKIHKLFNEPQFMDRVL